MDLNALRKRGEQLARARVRAEEKARDAVRAEDLVIQELAEAMGPGRGTPAEIARIVKRTPEHVRNVLDPTKKRGRHAATSSPDV